MADIFIENTGTCDDLETALIRLKKTLTVILSSLDSKNIKKNHNGQNRNIVRGRQNNH